MGTNFYPKNTGSPFSNISFYQNTPPQHNVDLRAAMNQIFFGDRWHPPQARPVVLRHMLEPCVCVQGGAGSLSSDQDKGQRHRDPDPTCSVCNGEGFIFEETVVPAWRSLADSPAAIIMQYEQRVPGITADTGFNWYFLYNTTISNLDKIWELALTQSGSKPINIDLINRTNKYRIQRLVTYRADNAEIEYFHAVTEIEAW